MGMLLILDRFADERQQNENKWAFELRRSLEPIWCDCKGREADVRRVDLARGRISHFANLFVCPARRRPLLSRPSRAEPSRGERRNCSRAQVPDGRPTVERSIKLIAAPQPDLHAPWAWRQVNRRSLVVIELN